MQVLGLREFLKQLQGFGLNLQLGFKFGSWGFRDFMAVSRVLERDPIIPTFS